jgi:hypothetical protein
MARTRKRTIRPSDNLRRRTGRRSGLSTEKSAGDHFALHNEPIEIYTGSNRLILLPIARDRTLAKSCALCIRSHASAVLPIAFSSFTANSGVIAERPAIMCATGGAKFLSPSRLRLRSIRVPRDCRLAAHLDAAGSSSACASLTQ